jgi:hypothetical protein
MSLFSPYNIDDSNGGAAGQLGVGASASVGVGVVNQGGLFDGGNDGQFGSINAQFADGSAFANAQAQAQVLAQAQNFAHAQASANGNSLYSDLELAKQLAFNDNYGKIIGKSSTAYMKYI